MYFEKIPRENRPEASCFTRRHNAPSYDVTGKGARNCRKSPKYSSLGKYVQISIKQTLVSNFRPRGLYQDWQFTLSQTTLRPSCLLYSVYYWWRHRPPGTAFASLRDVRIGALLKVSHLHQWFYWILQPWGDKVFSFLIQMSSFPSLCKTAYTMSFSLWFWKWQLICLSAEFLISRKCSLIPQDERRPLSQHL